MSPSKLNRSSNRSPAQNVNREGSYFCRSRTSSATQSPSTRYRRHSSKSRTTNMSRSRKHHRSEKKHRHRSSSYSSGDSYSSSDDSQTSGDSYSSDDSSRERQHRYSSSEDYFRERRKHLRRCKRSPQPPKMTIYKEDNTWHSFIFQFKRTARKYDC